MDRGEAAIIYDIYVIHGCCITYLASVPNRRTELSTCRTNLRSSKTDDMGPNGAWLRVRRAKSAPCAFHASHTHHVGPYYRSPILILGWFFTLITHSCGLERSIPPPVSKIKSPRTGDASIIYAIWYIYGIWGSPHASTTVTNRGNVLPTCKTSLRS